MDFRLLPLFKSQQNTGFSGLSGSDVRTSLRISAGLLNESISAYLAELPAVRELKVAPRAGNRFDVHLKLARPAFLPAIDLTVAVERQPELPANPTLVLHLVGGGGLLRFAGPAIAAFGGLPPGIRLEGERLFVDLLVVARERGQAELLDYVEDVAIGSEEGSLILLVHARVR